MVAGRIQEIVTFLKRELEKRGLRIDRILLFGSYSHGTPHMDSDLDIAVISPDFERMDIFERALALSSAEISTVHEFRVPIDLVALSPTEYREQKSPLSHFVRENSIEYTP